MFFRSGAAQPSHCDLGIDQTMDILHEPMSLCLFVQIITEFIATKYGENERSIENACSFFLVLNTLCIATFALHFLGS